jgi:FKBP-type peptidyl-prolyl cis-trans isomerase FkpA
MNKTINLAAIAILISVAGCKDQIFKKSKSGRLEYKIIGSGDGASVKYGNAILFRAYNYYNDSLMASPIDSVMQVIEIDSTKLPADYVQIFTAAKKGDSIITRTSFDSIRKYNPTVDSSKKGYVGYHFRLVDVITDLSKVEGYRLQANESMRMIDSITSAKQKVIDDKTLKDYLTKNNIKAVKTAKGTYIEITNPGSGEAIDSGKAITVDYRGMTLEGKEFDSSYDAAGKSVKPFTFVVGQRGSIEGMSDGLVYFKKGGSGRIFMPSYLAYGQRGAGTAIKPNTPLVFYVDVTDVMTNDQYKTKIEQEQKDRQSQMEQLRKLQEMTKGNKSEQGQEKK